MKIAMFTDAYWPRVNGVTVSVDSFSRALVKEGHEILIVCSYYPQELHNSISLQHEHDPDAEKLFSYIRVPSLPAFFSKEDRIAKFHKWNWVIKQTDAFNPDIIHINSEFVICEFGIWYARTHNLPIIYTLHTMWEEYGPHYFPFLPVRLTKYIARRLTIRPLKCAYRVIVPTPQIDMAVKKFKLHIETTVIPTGIDSKLFECSAERSAEYREKLEERFPALAGKQILLFAGRVAKEKNIEFLLNILPDILEKHPDVVLLIAGNGPDIDYYKEEARKMRIDENCVFTGYFDRKDLAVIYSFTKIFLFPSLTDTQGLVTLESMFSGTPVVAIGAMGTLTVMGGDNGGFMVKNDKAEFTARVLDLLSDPQLHKKKSEEAKRHAFAWSIEELTKKLTALYKNAITDYIDEFGYRITPVWELLTDKRWWKINNMIIKKRTKREWRKLMSALSIKQ